MAKQVFSIFRRKLYNAYNVLPYPLKSAVSLTGNLVPKRILFGKEFQRMLRMIKESEYLNKEMIQRKQKEQLSQILLHAYRTTEYYGNELRGMNISEKDILNAGSELLFQIPFVDKSTIRDNYPKFLSTTKEELYCDYTSTGGTSGEPFYFHINSDRSAKEWAYMVDQWGRVGFNLNSKRVTFRGSRIRGKDGWEDDWVTKERKFSSFSLTIEYIDEIWPSLHCYKPDFVYAYPSTAISLCQYMERSNKKLPESVKAILIGSENIYEGQDEYIKSISGKRVFKWYGHSEKLVLAGECEKAKYYHAYPHYGYIEFINEKGKPAKAGEFAEIVGTGFINTVVPFIRYRTGDYCIYLGDHCPKCGRNYSIFTDVKGRWTQEVLYGKGGNSICMSAINVHSGNFKNVFRYQFYQDTPGEAILKIMPTKKFSEKERKAILREFNNKFNGNVGIEAILVKDIPLTKRGKYKFIDQNCSLAMPNRFAQK